MPGGEKILRTLADATILNRMSLPPDITQGGKLIPKRFLPKEKTDPTPKDSSEATTPSMSTPAASSDKIYNPDVSGVNGQGLDIDDYVSPKRSSGIAPNPREPLTAPGVNINDYGGGSQAMQTRPPQPLIQPRTPSPTNLAAGNKN